MRRGGPRSAADRYPGLPVGVRSALAAALAGLALAACGGGDSPPAGSPLADGDAGRGEELFTTHCAACHGPEGIGTDSGPPLVHEIYEPSHHGDGAFLSAVQRGVAPHHWEFGAMAAVPGLDTEDVADIVAYVRALQREAGIE